MSDCNHNCEGCSSNCGERTEAPDMHIKPHEGTNIKKVIAVVSGKGGVGKSMVTSLLAASMQKKGYKCAVLDADITGPSIPKAFGVIEMPEVLDSNSMMPCESISGIKLMSINLLLQNDDEPVIWRGPVISGVVKQFWTDVCWGDIDYLFVDMPPGTGDVPLTVFQSLPVDGIVVVTTPQELVGMIVGKAVNMADMVNIPIHALVENMSYFECPDNGKKYNIFGESHIEEIAAAQGLKVLAKLPIDPDIAALVDSGNAAMIDVKPMAKAVELITAIASFKRS